MSSTLPSNALSIGRIVKPHGLKGEVKLLFYGKNTGLLTEEKTVWLRSPQGIKTNLKVEKCSVTGPHPRVKFYDIDSRTDSESLRDLEIIVDRDDLPAPDPDQFLVGDLIGFSVMNEQETDMGRIIDAYPMPANDIIELDYNGKVVLIPMIDDIIKLIDFEKEIVIIDPMEGLLDI